MFPASRRTQRRRTIEHDVVTNPSYTPHRAASHHPGGTMSRCSLRLCIAALIAVEHVPAVSQPEAPQSPAVQASEPLKARAQELLTILKGGGSYDAFFASAFTAQIPKAKFDEVNAGLTAVLGVPTGIEELKAMSPYGAELKVGYERGTAAMRIQIGSQPPHQVQGLLVTGTSGRETSVGAVVDALKALPGTSGLALARLGSGAPQMIAAHNADQPLAIGSAFKLVILAELVRATNAGQRKWSDLVTLKSTPLPGGAYGKSPAGTKISLEELAGKMIATSDNSATDILLAHLGREKVEAMLPAVGIAKPAGMRPFLTALELFKLKGIGKGTIGARYAALGEAGRRKLLATEIAAQPLSAIDSTLFHDGKPVMIESLEWFASASDLVRVMDWLRRNSGSNPTARAILSKNPGIGGADKGRFVGFKGGSEPGVINMTLLLQAKDAGWYALAASLNNNAAPVDEGRFVGLVSRAAELAAP